MDGRRARPDNWRMDKNLALVLGGGGAAGNAWEIGVLAGMATAGFDVLQRADLIVGTSAGATAAVQISGPANLTELYEQTIAPPPAGRPESRAASRTSRLPGVGRPPIGARIPMETVFERMRSINAHATSAEDIQREMGRFALESDEVLEPTTAGWRETVAGRFAARSWPSTRLLLTAVNARTGEFVAFDGDSGVDIVDAVTASCSLPGLAASREINGERYVDGGARSSENVELAEGYARVLVLAPLARPQNNGAGSDDSQKENVARPMFEGLRRERAWGNELDGQIDALREGGSVVELLTPDAVSGEAMGANNMSPATRRPTAMAGFEQGKRLAKGLSIWG